jgi:SAM-dependent methyltransferase
MDDVRAVWNAKAEEWDRHIGREGDRNRRFNSDPVLWRLLGEVSRRRMLDAGCGNGYLALQLAERGADVIAVDASPEMIRVALRNKELASADIDIRLDDIQLLTSVPDGSVHGVVSNYVLMDLPDHEAALRSFARVLVPGGVAVLVFLHPCFDCPKGPERSSDGVRYHWPKPYIDRWAFTSRWGDFSSEFITFHRSLSDYWGAITSAGFAVDHFEEPVVPRDHPESSTELIERARWTPYSVAFKLTRQ